MSRLYSILVVDDDPAIRDALAATLAAPGFVVHLAGDPFEAVRILVERPIDLMLVDIRMPELDGLQLARQAKVMRPAMHFIYMSGYVRHSDHVADRVDGTLLRKPFRPAELWRTIQDVLQLDRLPDQLAK
jgi:CheY-like chemotaxis protein